MTEQLAVICEKFEKHRASKKLAWQVFEITQEDHRHPQQTREPRHTHVNIKTS